ncbi:ABC transporter substrate-binding protein [Geopsychrobacter electrodiphilus]|uniref:ABC transporter substrate-binding protein n=1 Tax=Geopsychrobacter electrodiphilus TaxID=225196 RepID=UPI00037EDC14|nr:ABC transporter substrate-binding protein [Geopsychrobacter electrodiphilus]
MVNDSKPGSRSKLNGATVFLTLLLTATLSLGMSVSARAEDGNFKVGLVTFLSGGAAGPFGIPARNAAELLVEAINNGTLPAPYNTKGIAGQSIEPITIDEAGGGTKQVGEYRNLVQRKDVDAVIGYISSGDCMAIAPVVEEMGKLTIFFDCGTPRIFEENKYKYLFRTGPTSTMDNVAAARYVLDIKPDLKSISGINQNYSFGQDSWSDFKGAMETLKPSVKVKTEQFPKIYAGQYGAEISALMLEKADVIHSSFWGGDMEGLVLQGAARGLFDDFTGVFTCGETGMYRLADQIAEGTIIGARGPFGVYAPKSPLNDWFRKNFSARFGTPPTYPAYKMAQALLGLKAAADKAAAGKGKKPSQDEIIAALTGLEFEGPGGTVKMALGNGHQAVQDMYYGQYSKKDGKPTIENVKRYPADCVNPPDGVSSTEWIKNGLKQSICK